MEQTDQTSQTTGFGKMTLFAIFAGVTILAINMGVRQAMGLLLPDMVTDLGWTMGEMTLAFAVQNLIWGGFAPIAGMAAERYGTAKTLSFGAILYAIGLALVGWTENFWLYQFANGILIGIGVGASTFPIVLAAVGRMVDDHKRSLALGIVSAGGSLGQFGFAILAQWSLAHFTWVDTLYLGAASALLMIVFSPALKSQSLDQSSNEAVSPPVQLDRRFTLLALGFFVCGFHVAFISVHLPNLVAICNLPGGVAATSLAMIGLVNVIGTVAAGWLGGKYHKPYLLSVIYGSRAIVILIFMIAPKTAEVFYIFSALMGLLWLSTVPLTSGSLAQYFGTKKLASLFGFVMFSHQIGAFFGAWISGVFFDITGDYDVAWLISAALGIFAALIHLPIKPTPKLNLNPT